MQQNRLFVVRKGYSKLKGYDGGEIIKFNSYTGFDQRTVLIDGHLNNPIEMIPSGYWQAASSTGEFTLTSCCVGPGFDFNDFQMLRNIDPSLRPAKAIEELI